MGTRRLHRGKPRKWEAPNLFMVPSWINVVVRNTLLFWQMWVARITAVLFFAPVVRPFVLFFFLLTFALPALSVAAAG